MSIGTKNRLIRIYRRTDAVNEANEPLPDAWELFKTKWADVRGETGLSTIRSSASAGGVNTPMNRYSMEVNYDPAIDAGMQVRYGDGTRFDVIGVRHDYATRNWTHIIVEIGGANG